jgi:hypothetical protein
MLADTPIVGNVRVGDVRGDGCSANSRRFPSPNLDPSAQMNGLPGNRRATGMGDSDTYSLIAKP